MFYCYVDIIIGMKYNIILQQRCNYGISKFLPMRANSFQNEMKVMLKDMSEWLAKDGD